MLQLTTTSQKETDGHNGIVLQPVAREILKAWKRSLEDHVTYAVGPHNLPPDHCVALSHWL